MMYTLRPKDSRGFYDYGWLQTYHTFSFANYYEPSAMGFRHLRVLNEDRVQPSQGFHAHGHQNMEIISIVLQGQLQHRDSMGNGSMIPAGHIQIMSAGTGIVHSEFNPSSTEGLHFLQIWIRPNKRNLEPSYRQYNFAEKLEPNKPLLLAAPESSHQPACLQLQAEADVWIAQLDRAQQIPCPQTTYSHSWLHVMEGQCQLNTVDLQAGDGVGCPLDNNLQLTAKSSCQILWFMLI